jgi:predicted RNase H-like nuclease (RuvC/YqgF family)
MTSSTRQWERNTDGLRSHAQKKAEATQQQAEAALTRLIKEQRPITFTSVAETAGISTAWLYGNEAIKQRIMHLRAELSSPRTPMKMPPREQASSASKDAMIAALQKRVREQAEEIKELRKQLEVAYQHLY